MSIKKHTPSFEDLLFYELTVGGDAVDRAFFYEATKDLDPKGFDAMKARLKDRVEKYYEDLGSKVVNCAGHQNLAVRALESWFRPWTRLAGRIESELDAKASELDVPLDEKYLSSFLEGYLPLPEYGPYLGRELKGFVYNCCTEKLLDYTQLPDSLRTPQLDAKFEEEYPYCIASKEWEMYGLAYSMGKPNVKMRLREDPCIENGYIGGELRWSRYLPVMGFVTSDGRLTGIGQIDYKDCTNVFAVFDDDMKAKPLDALDPFVRRTALEHVYMENKYSSKKKKSGKERMTL